MTAIEKTTQPAASSWVAPPDAAAGPAPRGRLLRKYALLFIALVGVAAPAAAAAHNRSGAGRAAQPPSVHAWSSQSGARSGRRILLSAVPLHRPSPAERAARPPCAPGRKTKNRAHC